MKTSLLTCVFLFSLCSALFASNKCSKTLMKLGSNELQLVQPSHAGLHPEKGFVLYRGIAFEGTLSDVKNLFHSRHSALEARSLSHLSEKERRHQVEVLTEQFLDFSTLSHSLAAHAFGNQLHLSPWVSLSYSPSVAAHFALSAAQHRDRENHIPLVIAVRATGKEISMKELNRHINQPLDRREGEYVSLGYIDPKNVGAVYELKSTDKGHVVEYAWVKKPGEKTPKRKRFDPPLKQNPTICVFM